MHARAFNKVYHTTAIVYLHKLHFSDIILSRGASRIVVDLPALQTTTQRHIHINSVPCIRSLETGHWDHALKPRIVRGTLCLCVLCVPFEEKKTHETFRPIASCLFRCTLFSVRFDISGICVASACFDYLDASSLARMRALLLRRLFVVIIFVLVYK